MKKPEDPEDNYIELMSLSDVCKYTLMSKSSLEKRSRDPDDPFPAPEWMNKMRVWRAEVVRKYVFDTLTTTPPPNPRRGSTPAPKRGEKQ